MIDIAAEKKRRRKKSIQMIMSYAIGISVFIWDAIILVILA